MVNIGNFFRKIVVLSIKDLAQNKYWRSQMEEIKSLGYKEARMIVDAVVEASEKSEGLNMAVAVIGRDGAPLCLARMDGVPAAPARLCLSKAQSALEIFRDLIDARHIYSTRDTGHGTVGLKTYEFSSTAFTTIPGGCLIKTRDGSIVGAIGTSGRSPLEDEEMARVGVKAFENSEAFGR
jgi:uncharacterized protein GlcG (DUF336 family)